MPRETLQTLTESMVYILLSLRSECSGVDIMEKVETLSKGRVTVGPGTLYAMLPKLMANGLIQQTRQAGRQKWYVLTAEGAARLQEEYARLLSLMQDMQDAGFP